MQRRIGMALQKKPQPTRLKVTFYSMTKLLNRGKEPQVPADFCCNVCCCACHALNALVAILHTAKSLLCIEKFVYQPRKHWFKARCSAAAQTHELTNMAGRS